MAAPMNQSRQTAGTRTASKTSALGHASLSRTVRAIDRMERLNVCLGGLCLELNQQRQRLFQLVILKLHGPFKGAEDIAPKILFKLC